MHAWVLVASGYLTQLNIKIVGILFRKLGDSADAETLKVSQGRFAKVSKIADGCYSCGRTRMRDQYTSPSIMKHVVALLCGLRFQRGRWNRLITPPPKRHLRHHP